MKKLLLLFLTVPAFAQAPAPLPYDSVELCWPELQYPAGGSLADPSGVSVIIEVKAPNGNGWGPIDVVHDVNCWRRDNLPYEGEWSFRIKLVEHGAVFGPPSNVVTKTVKYPPILPWIPPGPVVGLNVK